jgi:pimeloyl-ACP methyl ester carboxylesterase
VAGDERRDVHLGLAPGALDASRKPIPMTGGLGCETARRRVLEAGGLALRGLESGTPGRPGVLLLHGGAAHAHWWDAITPALAERYHVLALDQRGHGESAWPSPPAYATEDFVADLVAVLDRLGWDRAAVVGHSMGGHNAIGLAAWHPDRVRALVIADARPAIPDERLVRMRERGQRPPRRHATREAAVAAFRLLPPDTVAAPALLGHLAEAGVVPADGGFVNRFDPAAYAARRPVDGWSLLGRITAPTLVLRGGHSPVLPREMAERLRAAIPAAGLVEIPDAYHHVILDRPTAVVTALTDFLGT